jgi:hypothetical protein
MLASAAVRDRDRSAGSEEPLRPSRVGVALMIVGGLM